MSFLSRVADLAKMPDGGKGILTGLLAESPALREYLGSSAYPDGQVRERSTVTIFWEDGVVKACLSDRDQGRTLWRAGNGVEDCLLELEVALSTGQCDWRRSGGGHQPAKKSGKK